MAKKQKIVKRSAKSNDPPLARLEAEKSSAHAAFLALPFKERAELMFREALDNLKRNVKRGTLEK